MPIYIFPHGFDHKLYYPIDQRIARLYYNYNQEDFMVLNLNRNQPRKRWDTTIIAWVEFVERHYHVNITKKLNKNDCKINKHTSRPVKLVVGTMVDGFWDLGNVLENEVKFRDVPLDYVKDTIITIPTPQGLTDRDINILYNHYMEYKKPIIKPVDVKSYVVKQSKYARAPKLPVRSVILGPRGSGKSVLLQSMILDMYGGSFDAIYIFAICRCGR